MGHDRTRTEEAGEDVDLVIQGYTGELAERHSGGGGAGDTKRRPIDND